MIFMHFNFVRLAIASVLIFNAGLVCLHVADLHAQVKVNSQAYPGKGARVPNLASEEAFNAARDAAASFDGERFSQYAAMARLANASSPVIKVLPYLDYWRLRIDLKAGESASSLDSDIRLFLGKHAGTIYADLLRRDWLYVLAKRGDWAAFDAQYPLWQLRDEPLLACWAGVSKMAQLNGAKADPAIFEEYREAIYGVRDIGDSCAQLMAELFKAGQMNRSDVWKRLQVSLDAGGFGALKRVEDFFTPNASEQAVITIARQARQDPRAAAAIVNASTMQAADKSFAWGLVGSNGMKKLLPESLDWSREAVKVKVIAIPDDALGWMARSGLRQQDWKLVRTCIEAMSAEARRDPTWVYWLARALRADGKDQSKTDGAALLASIAGQANFYGQLATEDLGNLVAVPPRAASLTEQELSEPARNEGLARAIALYDLGLRSEGNREWNFQLRQRTDRQLLAIAEWACKKSILDRCVNTSERTKVEFDFNQRFVMPFRDSLEPIAQERGVELAWAYGLIRQESRFIMDARSSVGASGLMQIMPATGRWIAKRLNVADFKTEQLRDRETNLRFGTYYLKSVLDDLDGSQALASAAYNAGPGRARTWRAALLQPVETAIFAELIPFSETRDYVKKVLSNATIYSALITGKPASLKARLGTVSPKAFTPTELP